LFLGCLKLLSSPLYVNSEIPAKTESEEAAFAHSTPTTINDKKQGEGANDAKQ
jgi:hypothetical protein